MDFNELTEEQKAKLRECKTPEEILALAREEDYELSDEQLEGVVGGWDLTKVGGKCPLNRCNELGG